MGSRQPARILAPLALVAVVVAVVLVVGASLSGDSGSDSTAQESPTTQTQRGKKAAKADASTTETTTTAATDEQATTYTVQAGDILSTVSEQTGVSVAELQELNPEIDPQALQVGQKLKLTPDAETDTTTP